MTEEEINQLTEEQRNQMMRNIKAKQFNRPNLTNEQLKRRNKQAVSNLLNITNNLHNKNPNRINTSPQEESQEEPQKEPQEETQEEPQEDQISKQEETNQSDSTPVTEKEKN